MNNNYAHIITSYMSTIYFTTSWAFSILYFFAHLIQSSLFPIYSNNASLCRSTCLYAACIIERPSSQSFNFLFRSSISLLISLILNLLSPPFLSLFYLLCIMWKAILTNQSVIMFTLLSSHLVLSLLSRQVVRSGYKTNSFFSVQKNSASVYSLSRGSKFLHLAQEIAS